MSFGAPKPPDPAQTAAVQQQYNTQAARDQNATNSYGQSSAYGSINYIPDASQPSGYRIVNSYSPEQQGLYNTQVGTQGVAGQTAQDLLRNTAGMYSQPFNGDNAAVTGKLNDWSARYVQPIFNQQNSNLEAELRNQGLTPGSEAYNNAKNLLSRNQGDFTINYLKQNQQQAFDQALKEYQTPLQTVAGLYGMAAPQGISPVATPNASIQPPNYAGLVQSNYEQQMKNYENMWKGIGQLGGSVLNFAMGPTGMFGGSKTSGGWG